MIHDNFIEHNTHDLRYRFINRSTTLPKEEFLGIFERALKLGISETGEEVRKCLAKAEALEPLPQFKEGSEDDFVLGMTQNKTHATLTGLADTLKSHLANAEADVKELRMPLATFLPEFEQANSAANSWLYLCCTMTCLKIIRSKAAANLTHGLIPAIEQTLNYQSANNIPVPDSILKKMQALLSALQKAAQPEKNSNKKK